jgi:Tat protein translocase TatB subunit
MFNIGTPELVLILVVALIVLGPKRLPELAKSLGRSLREFQRAAEDLKDSLQKDLRPDGESEEADRPAAIDPIAITPPPDVTAPPAGVPREPAAAQASPSTGQTGPEHGG